MTAGGYADRRWVVKGIDWGFPIVGDQPVPLRLLADARKTTRLCPKLALWLERG